MKIVFVGNRKKTDFWCVIAQSLQKHMPVEIIWIIQSHVHIPKFGKIYKMDYPSKHDLCVNVINRGYFTDVKNMDRGCRYFHGSMAHYSYYDQAIRKILLAEKPQVIFGEIALFHELLAYNIAKEMGILYLYPSSCRYPPGRFSFYQYDTLFPFKGSGDVIKDDDCNVMIKMINNRSIIPDYMIKKKVLMLKIVEWVKVFYGHIMGEHYNTASLFNKIFSVLSIRMSYLKWQKISYSELNFAKQGLWVLYPMQMQPEANIGVWGRKFQDQVEVVDKLAVSLKEQNAFLLVKLNPKCSRELSKNLIKIVKKHHNIIAINYHVSIKYLLDNVDLVITNTGTIAYECVFIQKPIIALSMPHLKEFISIAEVESLDQLSGLLYKIDVKKYKPSMDAYKRLLKYLVHYSYVGIISDPASFPPCLYAQNITNVTNAFCKILSKLS